MRRIDVTTHRGGRLTCKKINAYTDDGEMIVFTSLSNMAKHIGVSVSTISRHIEKGEPIKKYMAFFAHKDPHVKFSDKKKKEMSPDEDLPCIMFDKETHENLAEFRSVTFLSKCLQRPVNVVYGWVTGSIRCTDPDCYYKYKHECTKEEIEKKFIK